MGKVNSAYKRYVSLLDERFGFLKVSPGFRELQQRYLAILGRRSPFPSIKAWWKEREKWRREDPASFLELQEEIGGVAAHFNLAAWVVERGLAVKGYHPSQEPFTWAAFTPRIHITTHRNDVVGMLLPFCATLGIPLVKSQARPSIASAEAGEPSPWTAARVVCELPAGLPPEAAGQLAEQAQNIFHGILRKAGFAIPRRLRSSLAAKDIQALRLEAHRLPRGGIYKIVDQCFGEEDLTRDQQRRQSVKARRSRARRRAKDLGLR